MNMDFSEYFVFDEAARIWRDPQAQPFDYSDGEEQEKYILESVRAASDVSSMSLDLVKSVRDWPSMYHFSPRRGNIVRPFREWFKGRRVLEIGCGCGAITRFLGEAGAQVVAVEGSPLRALITRERTRDLENVQVIHATSDVISRLGTFDAVMLIGVLEYARKFLGENGTRTLLADCRAQLESNGILFLAIENQLGLKYFAGAPEDHLGVPMSGIEDRYLPDGVATFGRRVLRNHLMATGFVNQQWWYPFPDYKLPLSLLSEDATAGTLPAHFGTMINEASSMDPQRPHYEVFSLERAWGPIYENGLAHDLANSFLVLASGEPVAAVPPESKAFHYSVDRTAAYAKEVEVYSDDSGTCAVRYRRLFPEAPSPEGRLRAVDMPAGKFLNGEQWQSRLVALLSEPGWTYESFYDWFARWLDSVEPVRDLLARGADLSTPVDGILIDAIPRNLIIVDGVPHFIDLEWKLGEQIELGYLLFRAVYVSLWTLRTVAAPAPGTSLRLEDIFTYVISRLGARLEVGALDRYGATEAGLQELVSGKESVSIPLYTAELHVAVNPLRETPRLEREVVSKDAELSQRNAEVEHRNAEIVKRDEEAAAQRKEIAALSQLVQDKDLDLEQQAAETQRLTDEFVARAAVFDAKEAAFVASMAQWQSTKWYRLYQTLHSRPFGVRQLFKAGYLTVAILTPKPLRKLLGGVVAKTRQLFVR